jgi:hypothetical protein
MIILNPEQQKAVDHGEPVSVNVGDTECFLIRKDIYLRFAPDDHAGAWTFEEMNLLADEAHEIISRKESHHN